MVQADHNQEEGAAIPGVYWHDGRGDVRKMMTWDKVTRKKYAIETEREY